MSLQQTGTVLSPPAGQHRPPGSASRMNPGTPPGFPRSHRLCEEPPTRGAQPTRLKPALTRSAGWTAVLSAHRHPRGWGPHSPAGGPLCPHAARKTEGRRRVSKPTGQPRRAGLCPPSAGAAGRHLCRGAGALGLRGGGVRMPPSPPGASTLRRGHRHTLRPLATS